MAHGELAEERVTLNGRKVAAWLYTPELAARRTEIERTAASKRRLYRSYLAWAGNSELCGSVAEELVYASLLSLAGRHVWIPPDVRPGAVSSLRGRPLTIGGPLDAAGFAPIQRADPSAGLVPFAVEVKNIRSVVYPWHPEVWDLVAKVSPFPEVVPVLVARRIHYTTFAFFKDIGALGCQTRRQWFHNRGTARASIDLETFALVCDSFAFNDAVLVDDPRSPQPPVVRFFTDTVHSDTDAGPLIAAQAERWRVAAPIAEQFEALRDDRLSAQERRTLWGDFASRIVDAGLYERGRWAPHESDVEP